ncbi:Transcriptional activator FOSB/c-Fos and related bZIP transcription factors [Phaffia rhodozyma]|uniref:Transcriptional activator FOSB/c-Fos and related bZIP transcription factors n=1 Tax=Phaffia rhodozyma TaxID=264483 RepID=A0A0F7SM73_PHARH|nr:Transcriptional activator FOSB/c-Fos and related bZIP transcription factors [Phaffia rhodozyma]
MVDKSLIADDTTRGSPTLAAGVPTSTNDEPTVIPRASSVGSPPGSEKEDASDVKPEDLVDVKPSDASKSNSLSPPASLPPANPPADESSTKASPPGTFTSNATVQFSRAVRPTFPGFHERTRSKLDSEPNPFEQSFSTSKSSYGASSVASRRSPPDLSSDRLSPFAYNGTSSVPQPVLPSVSQITTPLGEDDPFKWPLNTPAISSIRGDPISPSVLSKSQTTPASSVLVSHALNFDCNNFVRTGLTPGTGMTPMSGGPTSFPPPSPGTAAFLAMVTNATAGAANTMASSQSNEENSVMTPGTFNGMMNHLNNLSSQQQQQQQQQHQQFSQPFPPTAPGQTSTDGPQNASQSSRPLAPPAGKDSSDDYFSHRPSTDSKTHVQQVIQNDQADAIKNSTNAAAPATSGPPPAAHADLNGPNASHHSQSYLNASSHMADSNHQAGPGGHPPFHQASPVPAPLSHHNGGVPPTDRYLQQGQVAASQAANGLFLLSQAHQAIARKEQDDRVHVGYGPGGPYPGQSYGSSQQLSPPGPTPVKGKGKRKQAAATDGQSPPPNKKGAATKARAKKAMSEESDDYAQIDSMMDESMSPVSSTGKNGKPETEEEKRKNFLERNRQAALKCRQRKKAWLGQLQQKVEYLELENGQLTNTISTLRDEVNRLQSVLSKSGLLPGSGPMNTGHPNMYNQPHPPHHIQQHQQHLPQPIHSHPGAHPQHHMQAGPPAPHQAFNGSNSGMNQLPLPPPPSGGPSGPSSGPSSQPGSISGPPIGAQSSPLGSSRPISQVSLGPGHPPSHLHPQRGLGAFQQTATAGNY